MKKSELKADLAIVREAHNQALNRVLATERQVRELQRAIDEMREKWRPVPITHPWQPRDPQCSLCDEPKDSPRHHVEVAGQLRAVDTPAGRRIALLTSSSPLPDGWEDRGPYVGLDAS